ncbi:Dynein assembly factor 1, axonemal homolog [Gryllus bimaculatus]|nr:Dynein assembly factor 1, axonemal homolog [Gryllus bimaculatus]
MACFLVNGHTTVVSIPEFEHTENYTLYHIHISVGSVSWKVQHRYNDFAELHDKLIVDHGVNKDLLPPKKVIGNRDPAFIEKRRTALEAYLINLVSFLQKAMPRELALFLDFHYYDITFLLQNLALQLFTEGDYLLQNSKHHYFTPLQLHAISERLKQPCPSLEMLDRKLDFSHVLDFCSQLRGITIKGSKAPIGTSNIVPNCLQFELSAFKFVEKLTLVGVELANIYGTGNLRETLISISVHYSNIGKIANVLLCDYLHKSVIYTEDTHVWKKLTEADFSHNGLRNIDESVKLMPKLEHLNLSNNKISALDNLTSLPHLSHIYLCANHFCQIENLHTKLGNIVHIDLSQNNIMSLQGFSKLYSLESLNLQSNKVSDITEIKYICGLPCLENLVLTANPVAIVVDYRVKTLEQFGNRASEICLDNEKPTQKELDTVAVLQAIRIVKEGRTPTFETKIQSFAQTP